MSIRSFIAVALTVVGVFGASDRGLAQDAYRLVPGDRVELVLVGSTQSMLSQVDVDGNIRLLDIGGVSVAGLTLDEAEDLIEAKVAAAEIYLDPRAVISIADYAPVVVSGDVRLPGRVEFFPGMTIATALGIAGGTSVTGVDRFEIERAQAETTARLRQANLEIADAILKIARIEAYLAKRETIEISDAAMRSVPALGSVNFARMLDDQTALLSQDLSALAEITRLWREEIAALEGQIEIFDGRLDVQRDVAARMQEELDAARRLDDQGLATSARVLTAAQRESEARARLLELETALNNASRLIVQANRNLLSFLTEEKQTAQRELNELRLGLDTARLTYARYLEQQALLGGSTAADLLNEQIIEIRFTLFSARPNRLAADGEITADTPILPGDTLVVDVIAQGLLPEEG